MTIEKSVLEKLAEAEVKAWMESEEGKETCSKYIHDSFTEYYGKNKAFYNYLYDITHWIRDEFVKQLGTNGNDYKLLDKIFILGFQAHMKEQGYEITLKKVKK